MANKTIEMYKIRQLIRLSLEGRGSKYISASIGISRNTVKKYLALLRGSGYDSTQLSAISDEQLLSLLGVAQRPQWSPSERSKALEPLLADYVRQLRKDRGVTKWMLYEQYKQLHPNGYKSSRFMDYLNIYMGKIRPSLRVIHKAGDKMYIDFTGKKLFLTDPDTGAITAVEVFVAILGCSQLTYVQAVASQKKEDFILACESALHYFGGVPQAIVPDNLKSAVSKPGRYESKVNESFAAFAAHYGTHVFPTRVYRPKDKALVEGAVKLIYTSIFTQIDKSVYHSLNGLNEAIALHLERHNNHPMTAGLPSRREQFETLEKDTLLSLNAYRYDPLDSRITTVGKNGYVALDYHYYSVPYKYIGKKIKILYSSTRVELFIGSGLICQHARSYQKEKYVQDPAHLASWQSGAASMWDPKAFLQQAEEISEEVKLYLEKVLERAEYPDKNLRACQGILNIGRKVGTARLVNACKRAQGYGIYNYGIIEKILKSKADFMDEDAPQEKSDISMPDHDNIRGGKYYQ